MVVLEKNNKRINPLLCTGRWNVFKFVLIILGGWFATAARRLGGKPGRKVFSL
jgi:hypothetical protein